MMQTDFTEPKQEIEQKESAYECSICFCEAKNPVVTQCGHLFCWECIYHWLNFNRTHLTCPVCKSGISENTLIPIFCRTDISSTNNTANSDTNDLPPRPQAQRSEAVENVNLIGGSDGMSTEFSFNSMFNVHNSISLAGYGYFPPVMYQALGNRCDVDMNPIDGSRLIPTAEKNNFKVLYYFVIAILAFLMVVL